MNREQAEYFIRQLFAEVWERLDESKLSHYYHPTVVAQFGHQTAHFKDIAHRLNYVKHHFKTLKNEIKDIVIDGDKIAARLEQTLGKDHHYTVMAIYQVTEGKVAQMWACIDPQINYFQ